MDFPDLCRLTNDPLMYLPFLPTIPIKFPSDIPMFEGNLGKDPSNHVITYHLWCMSNSLIDDSINYKFFNGP